MIIENFVKKCYNTARKEMKTMKLVCEYCDSYVDVDENNICPMCNAPLGSAIAAERARLQSLKAAEDNKELELLKMQQENLKRQERMQLISTIGGAVAGGLISYATGSRSSFLRGPGSGILSKLGRKVISSAFKKK